MYTQSNLDRYQVDYNVNRNLFFSLMPKINNSSIVMINVLVHIEQLILKFTHDSYMISISYIVKQNVMIA